MRNHVKVVIANNPDCDLKKAVDVNYSCQYDYKGKIRMIDSLGQYVECKQHEVGRKVDGVWVGNTPMTIQFTNTIMAIEYKYLDNESDDDYLPSVDGNTKKIVELFWNWNPTCLLNGKPHTKGQSGVNFNIIDSNIKTINSVNSFKDKLTVATKISEMTHAQRSDVAYFYGLMPEGKSEDEVLVLLAEPTTGYCLRPEIIQEFLKIWVDGKSDDRDMLVTLKKALSIEVIANKPNEGRNAYYLGDSYMGSDDTGMIDWARKNSREYQEHIVRKVKSADQKEEKVIKSAAVNAIKKVDLNEFEALKRQAKELIAEGFIKTEDNTHTMGYEKLKIVVNKATHAKNNVTA